MEVLQKVSDKPLTKCSRCGGKLEKQWSQSGFQFKGAGWYVTDYAGKKGSSESKSDSSKSDSKPASSSSNTSD
jgi:putative FmdB family regulatory protein